MVVVVVVTTVVCVAGAYENWPKVLSGGSVLEGSELEGVCRAPSPDKLTGFMVVVDNTGGWVFHVKAVEVRVDVCNRFDPGLSPDLVLEDLRGESIFYGGMF